MENIKNKMVSGLTFLMIFFKVIRIGYNIDKRYKTWERRRVMNKVFIFLADGFEEIEGLTVVDMLRRADIDAVMVSVGDSKVITGAHHIEVEADIMFHEVLEPEGAMYVLPGGMPGTLNLKEHEGLEKLLKKAYKNDKYIAAICAAPTVLEKYGMLEGRKATSYPAMEKELKSADYQTDRVVVDGKIITSRGMGTAIEFAAKMVEILQVTKEKDDLLKSIVYGE